MPRSVPATPVGAIVLAAGASSRMGEPKPLVRLSDGRTFLEAIAGALREGGVGGPILVVTGSHRATVAREARRLGLSPVRCLRHRDGQLASARTGLTAALRRGAARWLLLPCDLPHLASDTVARLLRVPAPAVPVRRGRPGHPLSLDRASLRALLRDRGARNLREAVRRASLNTRRVAVSDRAIHQNVNRPADLRRWERS